MTRKKLLAALAAASILPSAVSCGGKKSSSESKAEPSSEAASQESETEPQTASEKLGKGSDPAMTITWLSDYDLNPAAGESRSAALTLFEDYCGGEIRYVHTDEKEKFDALASMIAAGEEVDMFPFDESAFPQGVLRGLFDPLDPYAETLELDSSLWDGTRSYTEAAALDGARYVVPYDVDEPLMILYDRKKLSQLGLDDPAQLYKDGKWDWNALTAALDKASEKEEGLRVGGAIGKALLASTGKTCLKYEGGKFVSNLSEPRIEAAEALMAKLSAEGRFAGDGRIFHTGGNALFWVTSEWALGESNAESKEGDIGVVPFPKDPEADKYYASCNINARMLVKGSAKGEAVATYIKCERRAATDENVLAAKKEAVTTPLKAVDGSVVSEEKAEQYDAIRSFLAAGNTAIAFDAIYGLDYPISGPGDYTSGSESAAKKLTLAVLNGRDWETVREQAEAAFAEAFAEGEEPSQEEPEE